MSDSGMTALRKALDQDPKLSERFEKAQSPEEVLAIAAEAGISLEAADLGDGEPLTDEDLASAAGGYTFPPTDWIYCDNPWTNVYCTLRC